MTKNARIPRLSSLPLLLGIAGLIGLGCGSEAIESGAEETEDEKVWECQAEEGVEQVDYLEDLGCMDDFELLASPPLNAAVSERAVKTVLDLQDPDGPHVYFQDSEKYLFHYDFCFEHLSVSNGLPPVPSTISEFNATEYTSPDRRFVLGILMYRNNLDIWTWELEPNDTASAEMITHAYDRMVEHGMWNSDIYFHPSSQVGEQVIPELPEHVKVITTDELTAGIDYQPLNLGESLGKLRVLKADELDTAYVDFRDIVVLDQVPNDISVVLGVVTSEFQTPLSHINVLSQNRGTPNMSLRDADQNPDILALDGKWIRLDVDPFEWKMEEVSKEEADAWWDENRPEPLGAPEKDTETTELMDTDDMISGDGDLKAEISAHIPAYGGKASHYGGLSQIDTVVSPEAFGIPIHYYDAFMNEHGFQQDIEAILDDPEFQDSPPFRDQWLEQLRADMQAAPIDPDFLELLTTKLETEFPDTRMRFRSSTNSEDLEGFTGAGLYTSKSGQVGDPEDTIEDAIKEVWSSVWYFRAFEERRYYGIDHEAVGMALLVHHSFPDEEANGVALTGNPYDTSGEGALPGFYVNVQLGEASVVLPDPGVTTDQYVHYFFQEGRPVVFLGHSNLVGPGETVLTNAQMNELGEALNDIHLYFAPAYKPADPGAWYAMDVEFKFDGEEGETPTLHVKQARPHPGWGL